MKDNKQKKAVIYCRVSSKEQIEGTSLSSQEKACKEYAERQGISVAKTYIELGESAKTANRTKFQEALGYCGQKKNNIGYFIVYKLDRFARNQDDHVMVRAVLKRAGVELRSVTEPIDDTPMGRAMEGMLSVFAELDNNMRTERTKQGMLERVKQGVWLWPAPLGYVRPYKGANIIPDPDKAPLVKLAFEEFAKQEYTYLSIAQYMNKQGLTTSLGKALTPQIMEKLLKNPVYYGFIKSFGGHQGSFEPLISEDLFRRSNQDTRVSAHASPRSQNNPMFPLRKLVVCAECATSFTGSSSTGRKGKSYPYYHHTHKGCSQSSRSIPKESFEQLFVEYLESITPDEKYEKLFKEIVLDIWQSNYKQIDEANARIRAKITRYEAERQKIFDFHRRGDYTQEEFEEQKARINNQIETQRNLIQEKREEEFEMEDLLNYCFEYIRNTSKAWIEGDFKRKLQLQKLIFKKSLQFDGNKLGTSGLSEIYRINQTSQSEKSQLVALRGIEPLFSG